MPKDANRPASPAPSRTNAAATEAEGRPEHDEYRVEMARQPARHNQDGVFDGSFAGSARLTTEVYVRPWYERKEYFTEGWTDASIWRAAVRFLLSLSLCS